MAGEGIQVVNVVDGQYQLNNEALERILQHNDVRDKPVVVVSIAGAFRGGKSFILDFFLRYLNASEAARRSGEWIGQDDAPLQGFSWRTGPDRNTIGIHLWSQPAILTLPSGEKVAVLLMDTQGTFDGQSTMKDCTTIFALSTLISSVQLYNIFQNMKEDDLQHLELFTEYAQLVLNDVGKPFQNLTFLIRDWMFPSNYAFGSQGGKQFLNQKLQVKPEQPEELQQIRRRIRSCFDEIDCFLMAHPGFAVCDPNFQGRLADVRPEFKQNLLELVPMLFAPNNLTLKSVSGCRVTCGDLALYIRSYLDMFNSGELPTPATILQATAEAGLMLAAEAARAHYTAVLAAAGAGAGAGGLAVTPAALYRLHADAVAAARTLFNSKKILADRRKTDETFAQLTEEFDKHLHEFEAINESRLKNARDEAKQAYVRSVLSGLPESKLCMNSKHLEKLHREAIKAANDHFDQSRLVTEDCEDRERPLLMMDLNERYQHFVSTNELNNNAACNEAIKVFNGIVDNAARNPCMSDADLKALVDRARESAVQEFKKKRTHTSNYSDDKHLDDLHKELNDRFATMTSINVLNNNNAMSDANDKYVQVIEMATNGGKACMSETKLQQLSEQAERSALDAFKSKRTNRNYSANETFITDLKKNIEERYVRLKQLNTNNNEACQEAVVSFYKEQMSKVFGSHMQCLRRLDFENEEEQARRDAIRLFHDKRNFGASDDNNDRYKEKITNEIKRNFQEFYDSNEGMNKDAVEAGLAEYHRLMVATTQAKTALLATLSVVLLPFRILQLMADIKALHRDAKNEGIKVFTAQRRRGRVGAPDTHFDDLKRKIERGYDDYANPFLVVAKDLGLQ